MAEIKNLKRLMNKLDRRVAAAIKDAEVSAVVGFTASYALPVHENVEMKWRGFPRDRSIRRDGSFARTGYAARSGAGTAGLFWGPTGQAKFLEQPARTLSADGTLGALIVAAVRAGKTVAQGLLAAGLRLQREAQMLVPVVTGNLRASAFTRLERN